jgi:hypothetical protein
MTMVMARLMIQPQRKSRRRHSRHWAAVRSKISNNELKLLADGRKDVTLTPVAAEEDHVHIPAPPADKHVCDENAADAIRVMCILNVKPAWLALPSSSRLSRPPPAALSTQPPLPLFFYFWSCFLYL